MEKTKYIVRPEFRARDASQQKNLFSEFFRDFVNTISTMVFGDKYILTFIVIAFIIYISVALTAMTYRF